LISLARAILRLAQEPPGQAGGVVAAAMREHPELVSGTGADDARLMRGVPGLLAKGGAEGVAAVALPGIGAVALKIDDGGMRARTPVLVAALRRLAALAGESLESAGGGVLAELAEVPLLGGDRQVGSVRLAPGVLAGGAE
jgi:L-asparaginase II